MQKLKLIKKQFIKFGAPIMSALLLNGCKSVTIDVNEELAKAGYVNEYENDDRYIPVNYNPNHLEVVTIDSDIIVKPVNIYNGLEEIKTYDNYNEAFDIIWDIPQIDSSLDEDLQYEQKCNNVSTYLEALQLINSNNPLLKADLKKFYRQYESSLNSGYRYYDSLIVYEACVYQRMIDNNLDINLVLTELEELLNNYANDENYEVGLNDYPELVKGLKDGETLKDIYLPLALDLHRINCPYEHDNLENIYTCEDLEKNNIKKY